MVYSIYYCKNYPGIQLRNTFSRSGLYYDRTWSVWVQQKKCDIRYIFLANMDIQPKVFLFVKDNLPPRYGYFGHKTFQDTNSYKVSLSDSVEFKFFSVLFLIDIAFNAYLPMYFILWSLGIVLFQCGNPFSVTKIKFHCLQQGENHQVTFLNRV